MDVRISKAKGTVEHNAVHKTVVSVGVVYDKINGVLNTETR